MGGQTGDELGIVARQHRPDVENRDPRAQPAMGLRHFDPDRPAADDDQMVRPIAVRENRFVRQVGNVREPGDRRDRGIRAGRDDKTARPDFDLAGADRRGAREAGFAAQDPDPEPLEPLRGIIRRDCRDHLLDTIGGGSEIDIGPSGGDAQGRAALPQFGKARGGEQRLRGDAAEVQAIAAHQPALDQHDRRTHLSRPSGDRQARRPGADDAKVGSERPGHAVFLLRQCL